MPAEAAPRDKIAIQAPAEGSAKDAAVVLTEPREREQHREHPPPSTETNRTYQEGVTEEHLGLPFYPGSEESKPGGRFTDSLGSAAQSFRKTNAPVADVVAFYRKRLDVVQHEIVDAASTTLIGEKDGMQVTVIAVRKSDSTVGARRGPAQSALTEVSVFTKRPRRR
ncbi:MAG: hypothetical protein C4341_02770 [Armatimonadota bacterium]